MYGKVSSFFIKLSIFIAMLIAAQLPIYGQEVEAKKVKKAKTERPAKKVRNTKRANKKRRKHAYKIQDKATRKRMKRAYKNAMRRQKGKKPRDNRLV